jgi:hypothetical protein
MTKLEGRWTPYLVVLGLVFVLCAIEGTTLVVETLRAGRPVLFWRVVTGSLTSWFFVVLLLPAVRFLSRRARIGPATWRSALPVHLLAGIVFAVVTMTATALVFKALGRHPDLAVPQLIFEYVISFTASQIAIYGAITGLFHAFDYLAESEQRERERARLAVSLAESRLNALRSQLRPHFFFNTLNAISTFALVGRPKQVGDMVGALGELVRASLDEKLPHEIPLRRELELLELYLGIQRVRFADWLRIDRAIDPGACDVLVPSLMMQPLVENAIEHGGSEAGNVVEIRCRLDGPALVIEIVSPDEAAQDFAPAEVGVGLGNTRARLEQLHPGAHEFRYGAVAGRGFVTALRIPARTA